MEQRRNRTQTKRPINKKRLLTVIGVAAAIIIVIAVVVNNISKEEEPAAGDAANTAAAAQNGENELLAESETAETGVVEGIAANNALAPNSDEDTSAPEIQLFQDGVILPAEAVSGVSSDELIRLMGEPEAIHDWNNEAGNLSKTYLYHEGGFEFVVVDDTVAELNVHGGSVDMPYTSAESVFGLFGVTPSDNTARSEDSQSGIRFANVSDGIEEILIPSLENNKFELVRITYDKDKVRA